MHGLKELMQAGYVNIVDNDPLNYFPIDGGIGPSKSNVPRLIQGQGDKSKIFQFDNLSPLYLQSKRSARETLGVTKMYTRHPSFNKTQDKYVVDFLVNTLTREWPEHFKFTQDGGVSALETWTNDFIEWDSATHKLINPRYHSVIDAICMQIPEDLVVVSMVDGVPITTLLHVHIPNGWGANTHIGRSFEDIHEGVRDRSGSLVVQRPNQVAATFCGVHRQFERVGAINFRTSGILCRHPEDTEVIAALDRYVDGETGCVLRFERQTLTGAPEINSFILTVKTYICDVFADHRTDKMIEAFSNIHKDAYARDFLDQHAESILSRLKKNKEIDRFLREHEQLFTDWAKRGD